MRWLTGIIIFFAVMAGLAMVLRTGPDTEPGNGDPNASSTPIEAGTREVLAYFMNSNLDPEVTCTKVFPVAREIEDTPAVARRALEALFQGPTSEEKKQGYSSGIRPEVKIQSLTIQNGTASLDLSKELEEGVGGSCQVQAIRAQIEATLKQFPTVRNVTLTIDGRSEDILQP